MGNRKSQVSPVPGYEPPKPNRTTDHLAGHHFEDFLSPASTYGPHPVTPLQGAIAGPSEPEWERSNEDFVREFYGETEVQRRRWQEQQEPGGKTFDFKR